MNSETIKIKTTTQAVIEVLKAYPQYRDNDEKLVATIWLRQMRSKGVKPEAVSALSFLENYAGGEFTSADIIVRARAKVQENNPELRGQKWHDRHQTGVVVAKEIHEV